MNRTKNSITWAAGALLVFLCLSCSDDNGITSPPDDGDDAQAGYNMERTLSDGAQRNTIAFDALAFLTGNRGAQSFYPPGKVADYFGFQFLRDNDATELGHNTDFVTIIAFNVLHLLTEEQLDVMVDRAESQVDLINEYAYARFTLIDAFRRLADGDLPDGCTGLDKSAVMAESADIYRIDGLISYGRAELFGEIVRSMTVAQRAALDSLKALDGVGNWNRTLTDPLAGFQLPRDVHVAVMTYASEMFSWYAGSVEADTYFCPERQGTYFGSFYLKDWPAMGNPDYTIDEQLTARAGEDFLAVLLRPQEDTVTGLVDTQREDLYEIAETRAAISAELRRFLTEETIDQEIVMRLSERYGELDGSIVYEYATRFAEVGDSLSAPQWAALNSIVETIGYLAPDGAFLYSEPIVMPSIEDSDFLFGGAGSNSFELASPDVASGGELPADYTCDGSGATLPLEWRGAPEPTHSFALIMHHTAPDEEVKWYWILYDIPASVSALPANATEVGTTGNNSVTGLAEYAPPCSQGPGPKTYTYTVYALASAVEIPVSPSEVDRDVLLAAMGDQILATAEFEVTHERP